MNEIEMCLCGTEVRFDGNQICPVCGREYDHKNQVVKRGEIEKTEEAKCEGMRRAFGLIVNNDPDAYDCTCCPLAEKCGGG